MGGGGGGVVSFLGHEPKFCVSRITKQQFRLSRFSKIAVLQKVTKITKRPRVPFCNQSALLNS